MRTNSEIRAALAAHRENLEAITQDRTVRERRAKAVGWSEERLVGYAKGIEWAYEWFLNGPIAESKIPPEEAMAVGWIYVRRRVHAGSASATSAVKAFCRQRGLDFQEIDAMAKRAERIMRALEPEVR